MKYSVGDIVKFQLESGEIQEGDVRFIDMTHNREILYINSFRGCAHKVPEKSVISRSCLWKKEALGNKFDGKEYAGCFKDILLHAISALCMLFGY